MTARGQIGENHAGGRPGDDAATAHRWITLAAAAFDRVKVRGLRVVGMTGSLCRKSQSRTITFTDAHGRLWRVRVSDHYLPTRARRCHFNLVSFDGLFGRDALLDFIDRVAADQVEWFDAVGTEVRPSARKLQRIQRHY